MTTVTISLTRPQARMWVRWLLAQGAITDAQAKVMAPRTLARGDILVYSDWEQGRVEVTIE